MKYLVYGVRYGGDYKAAVQRVGIYFAGVMNDGKFYPRQEWIPKKDAAKLRNGQVSASVSAHQPLNVG